MSFIRTKFRAHAKAQKTVISNEHWFRKDAPFLGKPFTVKKTVKRHATVTDILSRAAKRVAKEGNSGLAVSYDQLQEKLRGVAQGDAAAHQHAPNVLGHSSGPKSLLSTKSFPIFQGAPTSNSSWSPSCQAP